MDVAGECQQKPGETAPQLVERIWSWVCSDPDSVAIETPCAQVTYRQLAGKVVVLAGALQKAGIGPEDRVVIGLPVGDLQITAVLAGYLLGVTILVVDPNQHQRRLLQVMTDAAPAAVVGDLGEVSSTVGARHIMTTSALDALLRRVDASSPEGVDLSRWVVAGAVVKPSAPMYLVYTSGSTGTPKGVVVPRRCIDALTTWQLSQSIPRPRTLQFAAPSFDVFHQEWTSTLAAGGTLIVPLASCRLDPHLLVQFLRAHAIERVFLPFVALQALCDAAEGAWLPVLREVITAGERLVVTQSVRSFFTANPTASLTNQYGPSETHVVTAHTLASAPSDWPDLPPIGVAIDRSSVLVLTPETMSPVSVGEVGELVVYGDSLAEGYRNDGQLTREKFPILSAVDGSPRGYRTGDLVRCDDTGLLHFVGRIDDQVKISGHRVELGEVDAALMALRGVRAAAAMVTRVGTTSVLIGYLVGEDPFPDAEVRTTLAAVLPAYSIPTHFEWIEELPKTASGKVDRSRLPARSLRQTSGEEAMDITGRVVCDVLQRQHVTAEENLLALGAQSLDLARISAEIFRQTGRRVAVSAVLEDPTIRGLRLALRNAPPWTRTEQRFPRPLNRLEQGVWIDHLSRPLQLSYNHGLILSRVNIPTSLMDSAIAQLQERHPILCSRTRVVGGAAVFEPGLSLPPKHIPMTSVSDELIARALVGQPFHLAEDAPVRFLLRVSGGLCRTLVVVAHHVALDGGGFRVLVDELSAALAGSRRPAPSTMELPAPRAEDLHWWTENLSGIRCAAPLKSFAPEAPTVTRSRPVCRSVWGGAPTNVSMALASFYNALAAVLDARDFVIGTPVDRAALAGSPVLAHSTDVLLLRLDPEGSGMVSPGSVHNHLVRALRHDTVTMRDVVTAAVGSPSADRLSPQVSVQVDDELPPLQVGRRTIDVAPVSSGRGELPLMASVVVRHERSVLSVAARLGTEQRWVDVLLEAWEHELAQLSQRAGVVLPRDSAQELLL